MSSKRLTRTNIIPISRYTPTSAAQADRVDATTIEEAESLGLDQPQAELPVDGASSPHWEKHFFMAPNVRFTRTPDRPFVKNRVIDDQPLAGDPIASMLSKHEASSPDSPAITSAESSSVADIEQAPPANVVQLTRLNPADHSTAHPAPTAVHSEWMHLSDHAFFELNISVPETEVQPIAMPVPAAPTPAKLAIERACASDVSDFYRVIDCFGNAPRIAAPLPTTNVATPTTIATLEEAVSQGPKEAPQAARRSGPFSRSTAPSLPVAGKFAPAIASGEYELPSASLLQEPRPAQGVYMTQERLEQNADLLESVLEDFGVKGEIIHVRPGPVVTLYEFEPAPGVKSSRVINLADDIARSMSAVSARVAVVPGRNVIGIELPNEERETVYFRELIESEGFRRTSFKLALCLGKDIGGEPIIAELARMPHLLVAGTTGSGKSVAINTMILSLLYRLKPEECRLIMVDPKMLELSVYDGIPHLLTPVVTDSKKAVTALKWAVREMEDRYRKMAKLGVRNIDGYNQRAAAAREQGETIVMQVQTGFEKGTGEPIFEEQEIDLSPMPFIVIIVDEMADLMMVAGKEIEGAIQRLAQMARAAGIHLVMATQRPSVDVITGTIKANFPTRISFQVTSKIDSRTILAEQGAEQLLGQGDMLHMAGGGRLARIHGPFVSDAEVEKVVAHLKSQAVPQYLETVTADDDEATSALDDALDAGVADIDDGDALFAEAVKVAARDKKCSTSYIQRRLGIGYNRAASLVERMEQEGLVGAPNHVGKREILIEKV